MLSTALLTLVPVLAPSLPADPPAPPGLVLIQGGRTKVGAEPKEIEKLILAEPEAQERARGLWGETPQHTVDVADFYLMVTEVTNEQYGKFLAATGHQPPMSWGKKAIDQATYDFAAEQGRLRQEAKQKGEQVPDAKVFDANQWWNENWRSVQAEMPAGHELHPVVSVNYYDAVAYARWAGLRLPTEEEFQRAVRGNGDADYPWGGQFDPAKAGTSEAGRRQDTYPVGSFPGGATEQQVFDLAGNVWEWTSSVYLAYPKYEKTKLTVGSGKQKRELVVDAPFGPGERVTVSGSYLNSALAARCTVRRATERFQSLELLGFRCAASKGVGEDVARWTLEEDLPVSARPSVGDKKAVYRPAYTIGIDRWLTAEDAGTSGIALPEAPAPSAPRPRAAGGAPPGYAVIGGYEYALFTPVEKLEAANQPSLAKDSVEKGPQPLGFLSTSLPVVEPPLEPGVYLVSFRGAGEKRKERAKPEEKPAQGTPAEGTPAEGAAAGAQAEEPVVEEVDLVATLGLDPTKDNFVLYDKAGTPKLAVPVSGWSFERLDPGRARVIEVEHTEGSGKEAVVTQQKWLELDLVVESLLSSKGFRFKLPLRFADGVLERAWRVSK